MEPPTAERSSSVGKRLAKPPSRWSGHGRVSRHGRRKSPATCYSLVLNSEPEESETESKSTGRMEQLLEKQLSCLREIEDSFQGQENDLRVVLEWRRVAMVMDRAFLVVIFLTNIIMTPIILLQRPAAANIDEH